ncbi:hypothetical protein VNO77_23150 [Canavalia gladiata]|uniref:Uncharacterized protein n=1 Tax=Canavalia gladiata TaxID=3824 RepID=A0AAN9L5E6_CANGL
MSSCHHNKETHGLHNGINENTSLDDVKAPNLFERAKEELKPLVHVFHEKNKASTCAKSDENQMAESQLNMKSQALPRVRVDVRNVTFFI